MSRAPAFSLLPVIATAIVIAVSMSRTADGYTPPSAALVIPVYANPAAIAATSAASVTLGAEVFVQYQGEWSFTAVCPAACDGANTCRDATGRDGDGGPGCWVRNGDGYPGANLVAAWYANSVTGDDANECQTPATACASLDEVFRRIGPQPILGLPTIFLSGSFAGSTGVINTSIATSFINNPDGGSYLTITGTRTYTGADGGPLFQGVITGYVSWDAGTSEGIVTVGPAVDGGPAFNVPAWPPADGGYVLEDTDQCNTSGVGCTALLLGPELDAGTFASPGGAQVTGYTAHEPNIGDHVRIAQLTPVSTTPGTSIIFNGVGVVVQNLWLGNAKHSVAFSTGTGTPNAVELDCSIVNGGDTYTGVELDAWGSYFTGGMRAQGQLVSTASFYDYIEARTNSYVLLEQHNLVGSAGVSLGGRLGPGFLETAYGPSAVEGYASPCLVAADGASATIGAKFLCRNSVGGAPAVHVFAGSVVRYGSGFQPITTGTVSTAPWIVGGVATDAGLPQTNSANFSGIVQNQ